MSPIWWRTGPTATTAITKLLGDNGRSGVPLYLYYAPGADKPVILPQILTEAGVLDAINELIRTSSPWRSVAGRCLLRCRQMGHFLPSRCLFTFRRTSAGGGFAFALLGRADDVIAAGKGRRIAGREGIFHLPVDLFFLGLRPVWRWKDARAFSGQGVGMLGRRSWHVLLQRGRGRKDGETVPPARSGSDRSRSDN